MSSVHSSLQQSTQQPPPPPSVKQELNSSPTKPIPHEEDPSQPPSRTEDDHSSEQQQPQSDVIIPTSESTEEEVVVGPEEVSEQEEQVPPSVVPNTTTSSGPKVIQQQQQHHHPLPPKFQDVRVDNWGNYCLQRLQVMYDRGDFCDLTLQFQSQQLIKVHRVVLNLCTEYFANLERLFGLTDGHLVLPKDVEYQAMLTIIKFFYTGKLEIRGNLFNEVYRTVKLMNITILIKLLEAHAKKPGGGNAVGTIGGISGGGHSTSASSLGMVAQGKGSPGGGGGPSSIRPLGSQKVVGLSGSTAVSIQGSTKTLQVTTPGLRLPPGVRTKTVLARVQPQSPRGVMTASGSHRAASNASALSKKLPIWKERKFSPVSAGGSSEHMDKWPPKEEPARPTRFEWGDPEDDFLGSCSANSSAPVVSHTLMDKQKVTSASCRKVEDIFDAVKNQQTLGKRQNSATSSSSISPYQPHNSKDQPPAKLTRLEVPISTHQQHQHAILPINDSSSDQVNLTEDTVEEEVSTTENPLETSQSGGSTGGMPKPILKSVKGSSSGDMPSRVNAHDESPEDIKLPLTPHKTVRFANDIEKENASTVTTSATTLIMQPPSSTIISSSSSNNMSSLLGDEMQPSHTKIITEVLKKYPDLVKDRSNIRLKIVTKGGPPPGDTNSSMSSPAKGGEKSKVSYIVLKSTSSPDSLGSVVLKKPPAGVTNAASKAFWSSDSPMDGSPSTSGIIKKIGGAGAENTTGPWLCGPCGGGDHSPVQFDTYYSYRRHLVEVHGERIDARICEYCGQRASKRNLLLYHLYTKHSIPPPKNITFPACDRCDYVALSESLLNKHKLGHDGTKEYSCTICNASFKSPAALQGHMTANLHRNKDTKVYECPYCRKPFVRNINLKAHIRSVHRDIARIEEMDDPRLPLDESLANRPPLPQGTLGHLQGGQKKQRQFPSILGSSGTSGMRTVNSGVSGSAGLVQVDQGSVSAATMESLLANAGEVAAGQGQTVSLVTADGHTIEILHGIDPSTMTSVPMTLVPSSEAEAMSNVANSIAASLGLSDHHHHQMTTAEFVDGSGGGEGGGGGGAPHAVYIMDSSQPAVEVDMSAMGALSADGSAMVFSTTAGGDVMGDPTGGQFIVQDIHGNQFRKITGIDENGKPVIFFQLSEENGPGSGLEDGGQGGGGSNLQDSNSVYVSSSLPVSVSSDHHHHHHQVLLTAAGEDGEHGTVYEMLAPSSGASQVDHSHHHLQAQQVILSDGTTVLHHPGHHQEYVHTTTSAATPIVASSISSSDTGGETESGVDSGVDNVQEVHIVLNPQDGQEEENSCSSSNTVTDAGQQVMESEHQQQQHEEVVVQDGEYHLQQEGTGEEEEQEELVIQEEEVDDETSPAERMEVVEESNSSMILDEQADADPSETGESSQGEMIVVEEEMHLVDQDSGEPLQEADASTSSIQEDSST